MLIGEFALSHAPVTNRRLACVIKAADGRLYTGHNYEDDSEELVRFDHAETCALDSSPEQSGMGVETIFMACENEGEYKRISPCPDCFSRLEPLLLSNAELVLFEPHTLNRALVFSADEIHDAYESKPYSFIVGDTDEVVAAELRDKTILNDEDIQIVTALRRLGLNQGINFYLTGSGSGRGWISNAINNKLGRSYSDLDIIGVSSLSPELVERQIKELLTVQLGRVTEREVSSEAWVISGARKGNSFQNSYTVFESPARKIMDLVLAESLGEGMRRHDYYEKNFFHQLS
jgi:cytidine deaminase